MTWFTKKAKSEPPPIVAAQTKLAWWGIFTEVLYASVDDGEALLRLRDPEAAKRLAAGARNLADAAIAEYEDRFTL